MSIGENIYSLFFGKCDIYEMREIVGEDGVSTFDRVLVQEGVQCHLVFGGTTAFAGHRNASQEEHRNRALFNVRVFTPSEINIRAGSIIRVVQNDREYYLRSTGESAVYIHHCETIAVPWIEEV